MASREETKIELYNELLKLSKRANQRLVRLERNFGRISWAGKILRTNLDTEVANGWTAGNRVRVSKNMSITQLRHSIKVTNNFLNSATSTKRGIDKVRTTTIKSLSKSLLKKGEQITYDEAEVLYDFLSDDYAQDIISYAQASRTWNLILYAQEKNSSLNDFIKSVDRYITTGTDQDMVDDLKYIYDKYVKGR